MIMAIKASDTLFHLQCEAGFKKALSIHSIAFKNVYFVLAITVKCLESIDNISIEKWSKSQQREKQPDTMAFRSLYIIEEFQISDEHITNIFITFI